MAYTYNIGVGTNGTSHRGFRPALEAGGLERVATDYTVTDSGAGGNLLADVWRSPAAANSMNRDWFFALSSSVNGSLYNVGVFLFEGWSDGSVTNPIPAPGPATSVVPTASGAVSGSAVPFHASPASSMQAHRYTLMSTNAAPLAACNATSERVVLSTSIGSTIYLGIYDRLLPASVDAVPLCVVSMQVGSQSSSQGQGGVTREIASTSAASMNWNVQLTGGSNASHGHFDSLVPGVGFNDLYTGKVAMGPVAFRTSRSLSTARGVLKDVLKGGPASMGDTAEITLPNGAPATYDYAPANMWVRR